MKKILIAFCITTLAFSINGFSQIKVNSSGYVGINQSSPAYNLDVFGTARLWTTYGFFIFDSSGHGGVAALYPNSDWVGSLGKTDKKFNKIWTYDLHYDNLYDWSDEALKENIVPLENSLSKLKLLNGVSYNMKKEFYKNDDPELVTKLWKNNKKDMGFIAQDIKEVFPELVYLDSVSNLYSVNYVKLMPVLVEAIKEQQSTIENMENQLNSIEQDCCNNTKSGTINSNDKINSTDDAKLYQNSPNPFSNATTIRFEIPETIQTAQLHICNMTGTLLKTININQRGNGQEIISGNEFNAGMYLYSLVCDGVIVDTKQMLLTK